MSPPEKKRHSIDDLKSIVAPVAEEYGVVRVYLFGSVARGDYNDGSDYDFYIELDTVWDLIKLSGFFLDLRQAIGHDIDLLDSISIDPDFLSVIRSEGVIVYEG
ncbi:MAG: nucleotidyltransferase domain-containing protein [Methanomassiliicoccaceae archaeon]|nr:nucleotidyltransferase domain-containing protein [Methanomassiliicoccaceae archaeon]